ncbi:ATPase inhibitor subunit zeta [Agrobacterium sp. CCNWLW71]|uniref:ATPase inhibitor subunit zeta n=1 Tax=unclassified Agrobacterium TaxID=2632611 RepID=UPI002FF1F35D
MSEEDQRRRYLEEHYILDFANLAKTRAKRDELLAIWAASKLGCSDVQAYHAELRLAGRAVPGDADILQKVLADLRSKGVFLTEGDLQARMNELMFEAAKALEAERA